MKKFLFLAVAFAAAMSGVQAQSLDDVNDLLGSKDYAAAKTAIDKHLAIPKNAAKADGWYFKARVYNMYSYTDQVPSTEAYDLKVQAFDALQKCLPMDPKEARFKLENPAYYSFLDLYYGFYDLAIKLFNEKRFDSSLLSFQKTLEVKDFILLKQYDYGAVKLPQFDTAVVLNAATAASQAKKEEVAVKYFKMLVDQQISGADYVNVYEFLADYYNRKEMKAEFKQILEKGRAFYPKDEFWDMLELGAAEKSGDDKMLMAKYEERIAADTGNFALLYDYAVVMYNKLYSSDEKLTNLAEIQNKLYQTLLRAVRHDKGIDACLLMSNHLYNIASDQSNAAVMVKGNKPEDNKKKKELNALADRTIDEFLYYANRYLDYLDALPELKPGQKANFRAVAGNVSEVYAVKGDEAKAAEYEKKKKAKN